MKNLKYFLQFFCILFLFGVFKIVGIKFSRIISENIMVVLGPIFRSKKIIIKNLSIAFPNFNENEKKQILNDLKIKKISLINQINELDFKNSLLSDNLDLDYIETLIRERFLFGKINEKIYIIKKNDTKK